MINILTSAVIGKVPAQMADYVIAKYAMLGLHEVLRSENANNQSIKIYAVCPAMTDTEFLKDLSEHYVALAASQMPNQRLIDAQQMACLVKDLIEGNHHYSNGKKIVITGSEA